MSFYLKYPAFIIFAVVFITIICFLIFNKFYRSESTRRRRADALKKQLEHTVLLSQLEIQEQNLRHISQEIHDNIGQVLSLAKLNLSTTAAKFIPEKIILSEELLGKAIADLREVSKSLFSEINTDPGLLQIVQTELKMIEKITSLHTKFAGPEEEPSLKKEEAIILFRIIQEILNNIVKHAKATEINVTINENVQSLDIIINDNGKESGDKNFNNRNANAAIENIISKAEIIRANLKINSQAGKGTSIMIQLPLSEIFKP